MDLETLQEENRILRDKLNKLKQYKKEYYQNKYKHQKYYCEDCDMEMNAGSKSNHLQSTNHFLNKPLTIDTTDDFYFEIEITKNQKK